MIHRLSYLVWILAIALLAGTQYHVSYQVQSLNRTLKHVRAETKDVKENIRILEAEWAYATNPKRLQKLSQKYLEIGPLKGKQIAHFSDIPFPSATVASRTVREGGI